jgi:recombination protein RecT
MATVNDLKEKQLLQTSQITTIDNFLQANIDKIKQALPEHINAERLARLITITMRQNSNLGKCSQASLIGAVLQCVQLGLEPTSLGHAYLIPYWNSKLKSFEAQFQIGYRGMVELVRRSGEIKNIYAQVVHNGDLFEYQYGTEQYIKHVPLFDSEKIQFLYMVAYFNNGSSTFHVMPKKEIDAIMQRTKSKTKEGQITGPWKTDYEAMAKKTVIKQGCKYLPLSIAVQQSLAADETTKHEITTDMKTLAKDYTDWDSSDTIDFDMNAIYSENNNDTQEKKEVEIIKDTKDPDYDFTKKFPDYDFIKHEVKNGK